jgi:hypothetical protein
MHTSHARSDLSHYLLCLSLYTYEQGLLSIGSLANDWISRRGTVMHHIMPREPFANSKPHEKWIQCEECYKWAHGRSVY